MDELIELRLLSNLFDLFGLGVSRKPRNGDTVVTGIVGAVGGGGGRRAEDGSWISRARLIVWREGDGPARTDHLTVELRGLTQYEMSSQHKAFPMRKPVRFVAEGPMALRGGKPFAVYARSLEPIDYAELAALAAPILKPAPYQDPEFGTFTPNQTFPDHLSQQREWLGEVVEVSLDFPEAASAEESVAVLKALWDDREAYDARIRDAIAGEYYELWRDEWRPVEKPVLDREGFKARLSISSVSVEASGDVLFYYDDGGMFAGHAFSVSASLHEDEIYVSMVG